MPRPGIALVILTIVGARPQFIKAAAVSPVLRKNHREILLHTGQHYDAAMSERFFDELDLPDPDIELGVGSSSHAEQTAKMLIGIEAAIVEHRPDMVLVYGDTNSTLAGALAAAKALVPIAHVEAGLRSFNRTMPEEVNRVITDTLSALLFCPSDAAVANLAREGVTGGVHLVGDVMADVLQQFGGSDRAGRLAEYGMAPGQYLAATVHRAENTDDPQKLRAIVGALGDAGQPVLFPVHPRTRAAIQRVGCAPAPNVLLVDPIDYESMVSIVRHARAVVTDSGGLQKEAYWLRVPCITVRDETEWVETVQAGWNTLTGADRRRIGEALRKVSRPATHPPLYGDGRAAERIVVAIDRLAD